MMKHVFHHAITAAAFAFAVGCKEERSLTPVPNIASESPPTYSTPATAEKNDELTLEVARLRSEVTRLRLNQTELSNEVARLRKENAAFRGGGTVAENEPAGPAMLVEFGRSVGGLRIGMTAGEIEQTLGPPNSKTSPDSKGVAAFVYDNSGVTPVFSNGVLVGAQFGSNFTGRTAEGIGIGSRPEAVLSAFGQPDEIVRFGDGALRYEYRKGYFVFGPDGTVRRFAMRGTE